MGYAATVTDRSCAILLAASHDSFPLLIVLRSLADGVVLSILSGLTPLQCAPNREVPSSHVARIAYGPP